MPQRQSLELICVDTDSFYDKHTCSLDQVLKELSADRKARAVEVSYQERTRYARRLQLTQASFLGDVALSLDTRGSFENLSITPVTKQHVNVPPDFVEIAVHAVALNFKDVINVLVPEDAAYVGFDTPPLPGSDFAGVVTRIPEIEPFHSVGDKVYGMSFDMLKSKKLVSTGSIAKMPLGILFVEASALPMVFLTVLYALRDQARLKAGDCILIHSAAGGVGSAAVQFAKCVGAKIYATASPSKHEYLHNIGITNMCTSRDEIVFVEEMGNHIGDSGFDVVLSAGNLVERSLALLNNGGCFLELGKRGILSQEDVSQRRPDVKYFTYTLNEFLAD